MPTNDDDFIPDDDGFIPDSGTASRLLDQYEGEK